MVFASGSDSFIVADHHVPALYTAMSTALSDAAAKLGVADHLPAMKAEGHAAELWRGIIPEPMSDRRWEELRQEMLSWSEE